MVRELNFMRLMQVPLYAAAQLSGATSAAFTLRILMDPIQDLGTTSPHGPALKALVMEIVVSFCMMFVTSAVATDTKAVRASYCCLPLTHNLLLISFR